MESNKYGQERQKVDYQTGPIIWGELQQRSARLLPVDQGTKIIPQ
jgi:glucose-6-phosphate isomerase